ncbi:vegetative cell wall protein gp1-like [Exaiptasia diaphana]|uniref:Uncharacterized protein n=1 Tax=Exaiptasia diaphana TaxID=2652724 RepID=A0A913YCC1_EXADI|nr:vegetative cell wall protein gp1-like [Exaiptasia diaphana]
MTHTLAKNITLAHHNHTLNITTTPKPPVIPTNPPTNPQPREVPGYVPPPGCQPNCGLPAPQPVPAPCPVLPCQQWFIYKDELKNSKTKGLWSRLFGSPKQPNRTGRLVSYLMNVFKTKK